MVKYLKLLHKSRDWYLYARGLQTAEWRSIATLITRKIEPHMEILRLSSSVALGFKMIAVFLITCTEDNAWRERSEAARADNILWSCCGLRQEWQTPSEHWKLDSEDTRLYFIILNSEYIQRIYYLSQTFIAIRILLKQLFIVPLKTFVNIIIKLKVLLY